SIRLSLDAAQVNGGTTPTPVLEIWYSVDDGWVRSAIPTPNDIHPTVAVTGTFPSGATGYQNFDIDVSKHDWSLDLASTDRYITLGIRNTNSNYSFNLYYSSDSTATAPFVIIGVCE